MGESNERVYSRRFNGNSDRSYGMFDPIPTLGSYLMARHYDELKWETSPCDNCHLRYRCEEQLMACRVFLGFIVRGKFNPDAPRNPTYVLYNEIFNKDDIALGNSLKGPSNVEC